jgi:hypothetical protein
MAQALSTAQVAILGDSILVKKLPFCNKFRCNHEPIARSQLSSGLFQDVVTDHLIETMAPRLVGVAANVHAVGKFDFAGLHVLDVQIYVED